MRIMLLHPSRSRPHLAFRTAFSWISNKKSDNDSLTYCVSLDSSDPKLSEYKELFPGANINIADNHNVVEASNAVKPDPIAEIIILISDDFESFPGWDIAVIDALKGKSGVLKTYDGIQKWIVTLPIFTRDYYQEQGYIYHPDFSHMFCDCDQSHKADLQKKLIIRNDIVFRHNHYSTKGGQQKDEVNAKADRSLDSGKKAYLNRCKNKFGLGDIDIFNLSPEAHQAGHVAWLKKELRQFKG